MLCYWFNLVKANRSAIRRFIFATFTRLYPHGSHIGFEVDLWVQLWPQGETSWAFLFLFEYSYFSVQMWFWWIRFFSSFCDKIGHCLRKFKCKYRKSKTIPSNSLSVCVHNSYYIPIFISSESFWVALLRVFLTSSEFWFSLRSDLLFCYFYWL